MARSRDYTVNGTKYAYDFEGGELIGISSPASGGKRNYYSPDSETFVEAAAYDEAVSASNIVNYGGNKDSHLSTLTQANIERQNQYYEIASTSENNEGFVNENNENKSNIVPFESSSTRGRTFRDQYGGRRNTQVYRYPFDINLNQDHIKISKYQYRRPGGNSPQASRPTLKGKPGDNVIDEGIPLGSAILPMPKVVDTNGAEWGKSDLNIFGLAAIGTIAGAEDVLKKLGAFNTENLDKDEQNVFKNIKKAFTQESDRERTSTLRSLGGALGVAIASDVTAQALGQNIGQNNLLARLGRGALNPNAELLFQGPVLRDFNFDFLMVARSDREGQEIRKIIRWFKEGLAPKFQNSTFLQTPDIFKLEYQRGKKTLKTVNQFSPGGLALRTIGVDYAPNGYWSAYRDSQPVSVRISVNFAELRPIYQQDQEQTDIDSVGF